VIPLVAASVAFVCAVVGISAAALVGFRWHLDARRFAITHRNVDRDEALAALEPRMRSLEERLKAMEWRVK
jgi:hypothetical protein